MNTFETQALNKKEVSGISLYPERASANLDQAINKLKSLESEEIKKNELNEDEKEKLLQVENKLGEEFEGINKLKISSTNLYLEYFLTKQGRADFQEVVGVAVPEEDIEGLEKFFCNHRVEIGKVKLKERKLLAGRSDDFANKNLLNELQDTMDEDGEIDIDNIDNPRRLGLLLKPNKALEKVSKLKGFKQKLKTIIQDSSSEQTIQETDKIFSGEQSEHYKKAKKAVFNLYQRRVNQIMAEQFFAGALLQNIKKQLGGQMLEDEEEELANSFQGLKSIEKNFSRYDKFIYGAEKTYNKSGYREQISKEIKEYADEIENEYMDNIVNRDGKIREKGLDPKKVFEKNISENQFRKFAEDTLKAYGELSEQPAEDFEPSRKGFAPDGKWQFIASPDYKSMAVNSRQRIIKSGTKNKDIYNTVAVLLGHEIEGHVLQHMNRAKIPLRLLREIGGDRVDIFAEGGAMENQDKITKEIFGIRSISSPQYIRAMVKKLEGGNYLECVKAFYDSALRVTQDKKTKGLLTQKEFNDESGDSLKLALNRAKRLFRTGSDYGSREKDLAKSKSTTYLEQTLLLKKLKKHGLSKYTFLGKSNLNTVIVLVENGLLNLKDIQEPKFYSLQVWDKIKEKYKY